MKGPVSVNPSAVSVLKRFVLIVMIEGSEMDTLVVKILFWDKCWGEQCFAVGL